jgi:hypothetical protein
LDSGLPLQLLKFYKVAKRESSIGVGIALADQFGIQHLTVGEISVGECAAVAVFMPALSVDCVHDQSDGFPFHGIAGELFGFLAEAGGRLLRMDGLRCVDADQANFFVRADDDCVAVDDADDEALIGA